LHLNDKPLGSWSAAHGISEIIGGELLARRAGLNRLQPRASPARAALRREWGTNALYRDFV